MTQETTSGDDSSPGAASEPVVSALDYWMNRPETEQRRVLARGAAALRRVHNALHTTDASPDLLASFADDAERLADSVELLPRRTTAASMMSTETSPDELSFGDVSPMSGAGSGIAPPMQMSVEGTDVVGRVNFGEAFEGPPGHVHGGWIAAAFDEVMGLVQSLNTTLGMTGTLEVQYRQPTPLNADLAFRARVDRVAGRRIYVEATLHHDQRLLCTSQGLFIEVDFDQIRALALGN